MRLVCALQKPMKRQKLRHTLTCQRLGLETPDSALLEMERNTTSAGLDVMTCSAEAHEEAEAEARACLPAPGSGNAGQRTAGGGKEGAIRGPCRPHGSSPAKPHGV